MPPRPPPPPRRPANAGGVVAPGAATTAPTRRPSPTTTTDRRPRRAPTSTSTVTATASHPRPSRSGHSPPLPPPRAAPRPTRPPARAAAGQELGQDLRRGPAGRHRGRPDRPGLPDLGDLPLRRVRTPLASLPAPLARRGGLPGLRHLGRIHATGSASAARPGNLSGPLERGPRSTKIVGVSGPSARVPFLSDPSGTMVDP